LSYGRAHVSIVGGERGRRQWLLSTKRGVEGPIARRWADAKLEQLPSMATTRRSGSVSPPIRLRTLFWYSFSSATARGWPPRAERTATRASLPCGSRANTSTAFTPPHTLMN